MDQIITEKLLSFQVAHTLQMFESIQREQCILDASDTGTGKTYCAVALCALMKLEPFIICPKSVITNWTDVCKIFNVTIRGVANYELLKSGKYYTQNFEKVECPYFDKVKKGNDDDAKVEFVFQLPNDTIIIFDEAHRCKNYKTSTSKLLLSAKSSKIKTLLLSATLSDKIPTFAPFGTVFGLYDGVKKFNGWMRKQIVINKVKYANNKNISEDDIKLDIIHKTLFPKFGSRMKIKELGNLFPQNNIIAQSYFMANFKEVDKLYDEINLAMQELKDKETRTEALGKIIRARQRIELLKVPLFTDIAEEALDNGYSLAIFVNYKETMYQLCHHLKTACVIHGDQTLDERTANIKEFQSNTSKIIISITQAGGVGISLHDLHGNHPRMSIISPTWSGQDTQQVLGRIHRAGSKSPAIQKIVYCAKSYEETICNLIKKKLKNITAINDGDLTGPNIPIEKFNELTNGKNKDESQTYVGRPPDDAPKGK